MYSVQKFSSFTVNNAQTAFKKPTEHEYGPHFLQIS